MAAPSNRDLYQRAFSFIRDPDRWIQGDMESMREIDGVFKRCFCSIGALIYVSRGSWLDDRGDLGAANWRHPIRIALEAEVDKRVGNDSETLIEYNDTHTHAEVVDLWRVVGEREAWL